MFGTPGGVEMSLYDTIGVDKKATLEDIKTAFRKRAKEMHPDKGGNEKEMSALTKAYGILSDEQKREHYDKTGQEDQGDNENKAISIMLQEWAKCISQAIDSKKTTSINLQRRVQEGLKKQLSNVRENRSKYSEVLKGMKAVRERVKNKGNHKMLVEQMIDQQIAQTNTTITHIDNDEKLLIQAIAINDEYDYEHEAFQAWQTGGSFMDMKFEVRF
jgi:curved DNA-binding protein CbpA